MQQYELDPNALKHLDLLNEFVEKELPKRPYPENAFSGRGIVIGAGGEKFFTCAWACVHVLRKLGCALPIEFWAIGAYELDPNMIRAAKSIGVDIIKASEVVANLDPSMRPRILNGWELKPFSVIHSKFEEVLYLDADCIPAKDPTYLFDSLPYQRTGSIFWPDLPPSSRAEWIPPDVWIRIGVPIRNEVDFESGQFIVNKRRCWAEMQVTMHINEYSDYWYKHVYGDKSTYHLAWQKLGTRYSIPETPAGWDWPAILQHDFEGDLVFQHACRGKESICGGEEIACLREAKTVSQSIKELRQIWSGAIWDFASGNTELAKTLEGEYLYWRRDLGARPMVLESEGRIGVGQARCEKRWSCYEIDGEPNIVIVGNAHKEQEIGMMFLKKNAHGVWCGRWETYEKSEVFFFPSKLYME